MNQEKDATPGSARPADVVGADLVFSVFLMAGSLWTFSQALGMRVYGRLLDAPGIFPMVLSASIFVMALVIFVMSLKKGGARKAVHTLSRPLEVLRNQRLIRVSIIATMIVLYGFVLIPLLSYGIASFIFLSSLLWYLKAAKPLGIVVISASTALIIVFLFRSVLHIPLP
ncbi:tripartite tricarboxylate transporter TctB family protein [Alkalispirochaeta alkalica]|uniref:tripartite tricarboxylate transporter TctB family protein n=1 Tax=Alkalispirochaeta alkalica TaxID=46356 RepID=UPI000375874D|nr:tripartite tricarboxylate transporter TctB family protein [Alkalispirochaeta alkalica]